MTSDERDVAHEAMLAITAGLAVQANQLTDAATALSRSTREAAESYRFSRRLKAILALGVVCMVLLVWIALSNRANGLAIRSCTTPQGSCYQNGQRTTADAVAEIVARVNAHSDLVLIATVECSRRHQTNAELADCLRAKGIR